MRGRAYHFIAIVMGVGLLASSGAGCRSDSRSSSDSVTVKSALASTFVLPMVVGLNPAKVVLGASGAVTVGANAFVASTLLGENAIVALGATGTTSIGSGSFVGAVWSRPNMVFGDASAEFYKTAGTAQLQAGSGGFSNSDENRDQTPIRQDPFWTYSISAPTTGTPLTVVSGQTLTLAPGDYGPVTVMEGGSLVLMAPPAGPDGGPQFRFASLDIEPGASAQQGSEMTVSVNSTLTLKAAFGGPGMTLKYLGSAVTIEASFTGDFFLAPNAAVSINAPSFARFFARSITVGNNVLVNAPALGSFSSSVRSLLPSATVTPKGVIGKSGMQEISSAVLTSATNPTTCTEPTAFVTYWSGALAFQGFPAMGSGSSANVRDTFSYPSPSSGCFGDNTCFPASDPSNRPWQWPVKTGGVVEYSDFEANTDNTIVRLDAGRVVSVGFSRRYCDDPNPIPLIAQGPNCPRSKPAIGATCNSSRVTGRCIYGTAPADWCECLSNTFSCTRMRRLEEGTLGVRMTSDCRPNATWTTGQFDPALLGEEKAGNDRLESYFDPFDKKLYVSEAFAATGHCGTDKNIVYAASTTGVTDAKNFSFQRVLSTPNGTPQVMTTVLDERARLASGSVGRWVHFATARCPEGAGHVNVLFVPPSGTPQEITLDNDSDPTTQCHNGFILHTNKAYGPSIVGISSSPPRLYVAYGGTSQFGKALINVWAVTLMSFNGYAGPHVVERVATLFDASHDYFFPQLIRADGQAGSNLTIDTPVILRYTTWDGNDTYEERAIPLYSGLPGASKLLATWSQTTACGPPVDGGPPSCFIGDYRYGSFVEKSNAKLTFFTPWSGQWSSGSTPPPGVFPNAATIDVQPAPLSAHGLVVRYPLDENGGTSIGDVSGNNGGATLVSGSWTSGHTGSAVVGAFRTDAAVPVTGTVSVSAWIRRDGAGSGYPRILSWDGDGLELADVAAGNNLGVYTPSTGWSATSTSFGSGWHHVAVVVGGGNIVVYFNGVQVFTRSGSIALSGQMSMGTRWNNVESWNGAIDEVRVYNRVLEPSEVLALSQE
jgi:hypothetical protein